MTAFTQAFSTALIHFIWQGGIVAALLWITLFVPRTGTFAPSLDRDLLPRSAPRSAVARTVIVLRDTVRGARWGGGC